MSNLCEEEAELANWDPRHDDYHNPKSLIIGGDGPAANFVRTNNLARTKEVVQERPGLYVRNVPRTMTNDGMLRLFSEHGKVLSAFVGNPKGSTQHTHNWAIVKVESIKDAMHIMSVLNGTPPLNLRLELAMTSEERERRKHQRTEEEQHNQEMGKLVDNFNTSSMVQTNKSGIGRGRIPSFGRSCPGDDESPRRPGSLSTTPVTSSDRKSPGEMHQVMAKPLGSSITNKSDNDLVEPSNAKHGSDLIKTTASATITAAAANQKVVVEMSLGSVAVGYRKPRPCILCRMGGKYRCSVCKAWYCSKICQVDDWFDHKDQCQPPPSLEMADLSIYNIDDDGNNEPSDVHQLINNSSRFQNMSPQNFDLTSKLQNDTNDFTKDIQEEKTIAYKQSHSPVSRISDEVSSKEINKSNIICSTPIKKTQNTPTINNTSQIANAISKINFNNSNIGSIENKQPKQDVINKMSLGTQDTDKYKDEPDFVKVSTKVKQKNETEYKQLKQDVINKTSLGNQKTDKSRDEPNFVKVSTKINQKNETENKQPDQVVINKISLKTQETRKSRDEPDFITVSYNIGSIENKQPKQVVINKTSLGTQETDKSRDELDSIKVSTKINQNNETVPSANSVSALSKKSKSDSENNIETIASVNSGGSSLSSMIQSNEMNGLVPEKQTSSKDSNISEQTNEKIKTTPNKEVKDIKSDLINKASSQFLFPTLCDEMDIENDYNGLILTAVDNYDHFAVSIVNLEENTTAKTIVLQGSELIADAPHIPNFEVTMGTLVGAMSEDDQQWYRAYVIDQLRDGRIKVFFIDYGNTEIVKNAKPLPDGILCQAAGLIVIAKRHPSHSDPEKLKAIIKLYSSIKFKLVGKKGTSMKVSILDDNGDLIGTYILRPWFTSLEISPALSRAPSKSSVKVEISPNGSFSSSIKSPAPTSNLKEKMQVESKSTTHGVVNGVSDESRTKSGIQQGDTIGKQSTGARPKEKVTPSPLQELNQVKMKSIESLLENTSKEQISIRQRLAKGPVTTSNISSGKSQFLASSLISEKFEVGKSYDVLPVWMSSEDNCIWVQVNTKENVDAFRKMQEDMNKYCENGAPNVVNLSPGEIVCGQEAGIWNRCEVQEVKEGIVNVFFLDFGNSSTLELNHIRKINANLMNLQKMGVKITLKGINLKEIEVQQKISECISSEVYMKIRIENVNPEVASILNDKMGLYKDILEDVKTSQVKEISSDVESCPSEDLQNIPGPTEKPTFRKIIIDEPPKAPSTSSQSTPLSPPSTSSTVVEKPSGYQGCSISEALGRKKGVIHYENCASEKLIVGEKNNVIVMNNDNPLSIMVIPADQEKYQYINTVLQEEIRIYCESLPNQHYQPSISEMCVAKWDEDGVWYRAACCDSDLNNFDVIFVDHGNITKVCHENIRPMDPKLMKTPLLALHCMMSGIDEDGAEAVKKAEVVEAFKSLLPVNSMASVRVRDLRADGSYLIDIPHILGGLKEQRLID